MAKFNKDSFAGTITVVVLLSLVCSIIVAGSATLLKPQQQEQKALDKQRSILNIAKLLPENASMEQIREIFAKKIETKCVDLNSGDYVSCPANFDAVTASKNPTTNQAIPANEDYAGIRVRAKLAEIYLVKDQAGEVQELILPIYGTGLWSVMYGLLALAPDCETIKGITYYDEGETPGLGAEIENPRWQAQFVGKKLYNSEGKVVLKIAKGAVQSDPQSGVDSLSGATLTSNGVQNTFDYWFGVNGFKPFLDKFKAREGK